MPTTTSTSTTVGIISTDPSAQFLRKNLRGALQDHDRLRAAKRQPSSIAVFLTAVLTPTNSTESSFDTSSIGISLPSTRVAAYTCQSQALLPLQDPSTRDHRQHDLPGVRREVERISTRLPDAVVLSGRSATHDRIVGKLERATWVHFACHGVSYPDSPSHSRLLVYDHQDHPLTVLDISRLHLTGAEFAFLSACTTAQPTSALTDEAIHLTSAFQLAGFRHVIGTLWSVNDAIAARVADRVYGQLTHGSHLDPVQSARALHRAVDQIRLRALDRPSAWAAYIHAGI